MLEQERRERLRRPEQRVGTLENGALPPPVSDEQLLVRALIERDERAFDEALDRLFPSMLHIAMIHVRTRAEAEDVVQDTWLGALRGIERFEGRSSLRTWLFRILRNRARTRGARSARMVTFSDLEAKDARSRDARGFSIDGLPGVALHADPERELLAQELRSRIDRAIALLPMRQRTVVTMRDIDGHSSDEVSRALGVSDGNQRVLLHRARAGIRAQLADYVDGEAFPEPLRLAG